MTAPEAQQQLKRTPQRRLVPIPDAKAALGGLGTTTLYDLISKKKLVKVNIGRRSFITADSLDAFVDSLTGEGADGEPHQMTAGPSPEPQTPSVGASSINQSR